LNLRFHWWRGFSGRSSLLFFRSLLSLDLGRWCHLDHIRLYVDGRGAIAWLITELGYTLFIGAFVDGLCARGERQQCCDYGGQSDADYVHGGNPRLCAMQGWNLLKSFLNLST
jgi:hypothetical protein